MPTNLKQSVIRLLVHYNKFWVTQHTTTSATQLFKHFSSCERKENLNVSLETSHAVLRLKSWKNLEQLSKTLLDSVQHSKNGLVVVNKPYGVASFSPSVETTSEKNILKLHSAHAGTCNYTLSQALPSLAESLGHKSLTVVKAPERYSSGVTILSATDDVTYRVRQCLKRNKPTNRRTECYLAVVIGKPNEAKGSNKFGIVLKTDERKEFKYPVLVTEWSKRASQRGEIKLVAVDHRVLDVAAGGLASLVEVCPSATRWHFIRVFLTHLLSPALGDHLYGSRVAQVMRVPLLIDPASDNARMPQTLNENILSALGLRSGEELLVPTHIHLHSQTLIGYDAGKDLIVRAPVPEHFQETCRALGLTSQAQLISTRQLEP